MLTALEWAFAALGASGAVLAIVACIKGKADRFAAMAADRRADLWRQTAREEAGRVIDLQARLTRKPGVMAQRREVFAKTTAKLRAEVGK